MRPVRLRGALRTAVVALLGVGWALATGPPAARADQSIPDDLIVRGKLCVGGTVEFEVGCGTDPVVFGDDTIRLKENNTRIAFWDTSTESTETPRSCCVDHAGEGNVVIGCEDLACQEAVCGSDPIGFICCEFGWTWFCAEQAAKLCGDLCWGTWVIEANDSEDGGANNFCFENTIGTPIDSQSTTPVPQRRQVVRIDAGAPTDSLRVSGVGGEVRVGFGTSTPAVELHAVDGDTPTLRLEQDGSLPFPPYTWDLAGNEANFFLRDTTNANSLPFRILPGAPGNSLVTVADGDIGLGTALPAASLHVVRAGPSTLALEDTSAPTTWTAGSAGVDFAIDNGDCSGGADRCLIVNSSGDLQIDGAFAQGSSRASKRDIQPVDPQAVLARVAALPIATWRYRDDPQGARHMGPMAEDFHAAFSLGSDDRQLGIGDTAGVALLAIQGLIREIEALRADPDGLADRLRALEARLPEEPHGYQR